MLKYFIDRLFRKNKNAMEIQEIGKMLLAVFLLLVLILIIIVLFKGEGFKIIEKIKDVLHFSR